MLRSLRSVSRVGLVCLATVGLGIAGCGSDRSPTYPVQGKVVFDDGKPLSGGTVEFQSASETGKPVNASGTINADGTFRLGTYAADDGAVPGTHRAIVQPPQQEVDLEERVKPPEPILDPKFQSYDTSGLKFEVKPGDNQFTIQVARPKK